MAKKPTPKRKAGRPAFQPTEEQRRQVEIMTASGMTEYDIARVIGVAKHTLRNHFAEEMALGRAKTNAAVATILLEKALAGHPTCMIFWLKSRAGWRDSGERVAVMVPAEGPIAPAPDSQEPETAAKDDPDGWDSLLN